MSSTALIPFLRQVHRWMAIMLAPIFLIMILSGTVLSFRPIVSNLNAHAAKTATVDVAALKELIKKLEAKAPIDKISVVDNGHSLQVENKAGAAVIWDIASGELINAEAPGPDIFDITEKLHKSLLLGLGFVVQVAAWVMLAIMLIGPTLAWLKFRNTLIGWHKALGWCALPITILWPLTGILMTLHISTGGKPPPPATRPVSFVEALDVSSHDVDLTHLLAVRRFRGGSVLLQTDQPPGHFAVTEKGVTALSGGPDLVQSNP